MTTMLLIRHGANDWVHGRLAGRIPGIHLNDVGRQQAQAVAQRLHDIPLVAVYASPLDRTMETAQAIVQEREMTITQVPALREVDYGEWQGAELKVPKCAWCRHSISYAPLMVNTTCLPWCHTPISSNWRVHTISACTWISFSVSKSQRAL
ncbi:MAG: hypothetical protein RL076_1967 [Chloroflexota bacterium]